MFAGNFRRSLGLALFGAVIGIALTLSTATRGFAAEAQEPPPQLPWSWKGAFGTFDRAQIQRGFQIYREVCQTCHGLTRVAFRNLSEPGGPEFSKSQVAALAAEYKIKDGPNDAGDMFERPGRAADRFPAPFPNEQAAAAANGGKAPPDLSLIAKARTYERGFPAFVTDVFWQYSENGADYLTALLTGYEEPPAGFVVPEGGTTHYNKYFPGHLIAMPRPISDGQVSYPKDANGRSVVPETIGQYSRDVTAFLMWAAEPHLEARKRMGFTVIPFLVLLAALLFYTKKKIWHDLAEAGERPLEPPSALARVAPREF